MMKNICILSALAITTLFVSCQNDDVKPGKGNSIGIAGLSIEQTASSRAANVTVRELPPIEINGSIITVTETITPIEYGTSRAGEMTLATLQNTGFTLDGYIKYAGSTTGTPFMTDQVSYDKNTSKWVLANTNYWCEDIEHIFWAHYGNVTGFKVGDTPISAEFSYTTDGKEDVLIANHNQFFNSETSSNPLIEKLPFTHALANIVIDNQITILEQNTQGGKFVESPNRAEIMRVFMNAFTHGTCTTTHNGDGNDYTYEWKELTTEAKIPIYHPASESTVGFTIPQAMADNAGKRDITIEVFDNQAFDVGGKETALTSNTTTATFWDVEKSGATPNWIAGYKYTYTLKGNIKMPYNDGKIEIPDTFLGKGFHAINIGSLNKNNYIKKFKVTWIGVPSTNGQGTYAGCSIEHPGVDVKEDPYKSYYIDNGDKWKSDYVNLQWSYDAKANALDGTKGTYDPTTKECSATFDLDKLGFNTAKNSEAVIWLTYNGGSGAADKVYWNLTNFQIEILEYR